MSDTNNSIRFAVMPQPWFDDDEAENLTSLAISPADFDGGMYDGSFDEEISDALSDFGIYEVQEGAFNYEGDEPFDAQKLIDFLAERGITATEDEVQIADEE